MQLEDFPRPADGVRRGVYWSAITAYPADWAVSPWLDELHAMQIRWVKLLDDGLGSAGSIARRLVDAGMLPIVRLARSPRSNPSRLGAQDLDTVRRLLDAGVHYFETNNEPDLRLSWQGPQPASWLDVVVDNFIIDAEKLLALGALPGMPAMSMGSAVDPIQKLVQRERGDLFAAGAWLAVHSYTVNRPLDYPFDPVNRNGEPVDQADYDRLVAWAWDGRPREAINAWRASGCRSDAALAGAGACFLSWRALDERAYAALGTHVPMIITEGGPVVGWQDDKRYPRVTPQAHADLVAGIDAFLRGAQPLAGEACPDYLLGMCYTILANAQLGSTDPVWENAAWYTNRWDTEFDVKGVLPAAAVLKSTPAVQAPAVQAPAVQAPAVQAPAVQAPAVQAPAVQAPAEQVAPDLQPAPSSPEPVAAVHEPVKEEPETSRRDSARAPEMAALASLPSPEPEHAQPVAASAEQERCAAEPALPATRATSAISEPAEAAPETSRRDSVPAPEPEHSEPEALSAEQAPSSDAELIAPVIQAADTVQELAEPTHESPGQDSVPALELAALASLLTAEPSHPEPATPPAEQEPSISDQTPLPSQAAAVAHEQVEAALETSGRDSVPAQGSGSIQDTVPAEPAAPSEEPATEADATAPDQEVTPVATELPATEPAVAPPVPAEGNRERADVTGTALAAAGLVAAARALSPAGEREPEAKPGTIQAETPCLEAVAGHQAPPLEAPGPDSPETNKPQPAAPETPSVTGQAAGPNAALAAQAKSADAAMRAAEAQPTPAAAPAVPVRDMPGFPAAMEPHGPPAAPAGPAQSALGGKVFDQVGGPVAGLVVSLRRYSRELRETTTANDGAFRFTGLPQGVYEIRVNNVTIAGLALDGTVKRGLKLSLGTPGAGPALIDGVVQGAAPGRRLILTGEAGSQEQVLAPDGRFSFPDLQPGDYTLALSGIGTVAEAVTLGPGSLYKLILPVRSRILGQIHEPQPGWLAVLYAPALRSWSRQHLVDAHGVFSFEDLPPGLYRLSVAGRTLPEELELTGENTLVLPVMDSAPGHSTLAGHLTDATASPQPDVPVVLYRDSLFAARAHTGPDGSYRFVQLPGGNYTLEAEDIGRPAGDITLDGHRSAAHDWVLPAPPESALAAARPTEPAAESGLGQADLPAATPAQPTQVPSSPPAEPAPALLDVTDEMAPVEAAEIPAAGVETVPPPEEAGSSSLGTVAAAVAVATLERLAAPEEPAAEAAPMEAADSVEIIAPEVPPAQPAETAPLETTDSGQVTAPEARPTPPAEAALTETADSIEIPATEAAPAVPGEAAPIETAESIQFVAPEAPPAKPTAEAVITEATDAGQVMAPEAPPAERAAPAPVPEAEKPPAPATDTAQAPSPGFSIAHYLLFGPLSGTTAAGEQAAETRLTLALATEYLRRTGATGGFNLDEARLAANVTVIGDQVPAAVDETLRAAGCQVTRMAGDGYALAQSFAQLLSGMGVG